MPDVKVYIREENLIKWKNIANKSEWINTLLANSDNTSEYGKSFNTLIGPTLQVLKETVPDDAWETLELNALLEKREPVEQKQGYNYTMQCCITNRPDPSTGIVPCSHWSRMELGYQHFKTGEIIEV